MITGTIKGQSLRLSAPVIAADTINYLTARFLFSEEWDGLMIFAHFGCGSVNYDAPLVDGELTEESHVNLGAGTWSVWLHGEGYSDGKLVKRITTVQALLIVKPTGTFDGEPFPATPSEIERLHAEFDKMKRGVQADWGENDETAASYVKNRPGGYTVKQKQKTTVTVPAGEQNGEDFTAFPPFEVGDTVSITVNGTEYSLVARRPDDAPDGLNIALIGDAPNAETKEYGWYFFRNYTDSDNTITSFINATDDGMTVEFYAVDAVEEDVPVKFDPKYIDFTSAPQADWTENDETSPSFVKNRPFYAEVGEQVVGSGFTGWELTAGARNDGMIAKVKINDVIYENISPLGDPSYSFVSYNIGEWEITFLKSYGRVSISPSTISDSDILFLDIATTYHAIPEEFIPALSDIRSDIGLMKNHMYFGSNFSGRNSTSVDLSNASRANLVLLVQSGNGYGKLKYTQASKDGKSYYDIISSKTGVKITEDEIPYGVMALYRTNNNYICINPI